MRIDSNKFLLYKPCKVSITKVEKVLKLPKKPIFINKNQVESGSEIFEDKDKNNPNKNDDIILIKDVLKDILDFPGNASS